MFDSISMIGLGYIGLPTATMFASRKKHVIGVDVSPLVVDTINRGQIHIVEPELDILVRSVVTEGYLRATLQPEAADAFLIAVPTPFKEGHKPDVTLVEAAVRSIAPVLRPGNLVVLESTSPVGTTEALNGWLAAERPDLRFPLQSGEEADVQIAYCPERVLPGKVVHELVSNDRVIGGLTAKASNMAVELYRTFVEGKCIVTNARTAEMCKLTENSFRDVNIAFANELSMICEKLDINVWELIQLANRHPRVNILQPGTGVGGHCIAVDPWFIVDSTPDDARLIRTAREVNDHKPHWLLGRIQAAIEALGLTRPPVVACLGLTFKPNIDDTRESPALEVAQAVAAKGCRVLAVEPHLTQLPASLTPVRIELRSLESALAESDVVVVLVRHQQFELAKKRILDSSAPTIDAVGLAC